MFSLRAWLQLLQLDGADTVYLEALFVATFIQSVRYLSQKL